MKSFLFCCVIVGVAFPAFSQTITSAVYSLDQLPAVNQTGYEERTLLEGTTRDYSHLIVQAITIRANQPAQPTQQLDEEAILIIKTGELTLTLGGKRKRLGPGSVVMIMPGDDFQITNKATQALTYYLMRYTSNEMPDLDLYQLVGSSFWVDWQEAATTTNHPWGSRRTVTCSSVMSTRIAMQVMTLDPALSNDEPHSHRAAEIILILDHPAQAKIAGSLNGVKAGDFIFVESEVPHGFQAAHQTGCTYLSIQF